MTPYLIAAREGIIWWVTLNLMIVYGAIEAEIDRHVVSP
jgi:hypothetical protein